MASIRTAGLAKNFGDLRAVNEIDLDLPEGGVAGFVGPNGAGKSTTTQRAEKKGWGSGPRPFLLPLFTQVPRRGVLRSSPAVS